MFLLMIFSNIMQMIIPIMSATIVTKLNSEAVMVYTLA